MALATSTTSWVAKHVQEVEDSEPTSSSTTLHDDVFAPLAMKEVDQQNEKPFDVFRRSAPGQNTSEQTLPVDDPDFVEASPSTEPLPVPRNKLLVLCFSVWLVVLCVALDNTSMGPLETHQPSGSSPVRCDYANNPIQSSPQQYPVSRTLSIPSRTYHGMALRTCYVRVHYSCSMSSSTPTFVLNGCS